MVVKWPSFEAECVHWHGVNSNTTDTPGTLDDVVRDRLWDEMVARVKL